MSNYTIVSGDCLSQIVYNQYGKHINSYADAVKIMNVVAKDNNISDINLIYAGDTLNLRSYESLFDIPKKEEESAVFEEKENEEEVKNTKFSKFNNWLKGAASAVQENSKKPATTPLKIKDFKFVDTNVSYQDQAFIEPWIEGVTDLAESNIKVSDTDKDGAISYKEYVNQEISNYNETYSDLNFEINPDTGEVLNDTIGMNQYMQSGFNVIDMNKNSKIDCSELSSYYGALDILDSDTGTADGKINFNSVSSTDVTDNKFIKKIQAVYQQMFAKKEL